MDIFIELDKFNNVVYYDEPHVYYIDGKKVISTTQLLSKFKDKFDEDYWSKKKADERGVTQDVILNEWLYKNRHATYEGSTLHNFIENHLNNKVIPPSMVNYEGDIKYGEIEVTYKKMEQQFLSFYDNIRGKMIPIKSELVIGDAELGIGGMVDQLFYNKKHNQIQIWDWKTNGKIRKSNRWNNMNHCLSHLEECEMNTYSLQLSIYKYIIERNTNLKIGDNYIVWFNEENSNYVIYKCYNFIEEVREIFKYKNNNPQLFG